MTLDTRHSAFFRRLAASAAGLAAGAALAQDAPSPARQTELVRMVRQDCGSCHGLRLTGGLGPALTPERLREWPLDSLTATIYHGRPGTPMPGWKTLLSETDAGWIARQLQAGFPQESKP
jgi:cytochrome c55X